MMNMTFDKSLELHRNGNNDFAIATSLCDYLINGLFLYSFSRHIDRSINRAGINIIVDVVMRHRFHKMINI